MTNEQRRARLDGLPWGASGVADGTRATLTREQIIEAAIRLVDAEGLAALSMRRLGHELDAGATSLYWHIKDKRQLEDLMLDALFAEVVAEVLPADGWRGSLAEVARILRRVLVRHRHIAPLLGARRTIGPHALDATERMMGILRDAGFDGRAMSMASRALMDHASGFALLESRSSHGAWGSPTLPPDRYPNVLAVAGLSVDEDEQFEYGLQRLLDGLERDLARGSADQAGSPAAREGAASGAREERSTGPAAMVLL